MKKYEKLGTRKKKWGNKVKDLSQVCFSELIIDEGSINFGF